MSPFGKNSEGGSAGYPKKVTKEPSFCHLLRALDSSPSTNLVVKEAIDAGQPEGLVVMAFEQSSGYGRLGRAWSSPAGGLYFSMLLRPDVDMATMPTISFLVALAVRRALKEVLPEAQADQVGVKWPNDIVLVGGVETSGPASSDGSLRKRFRKLVGISQELRHGALCVGVGMNVFRPFVEVEVGGKNAPAYISELAGRGDVKVCEKGLTDGQKAFIADVNARYLEAFGPMYEIWKSEGFFPFAEEYKEASCLQGLYVQMQNQRDEGIVEGTVDGVDLEGHLVLVTPDGERVKLSSGEVTLL